VLNGHEKVRGADESLVAGHQWAFGTRVFLCSRRVAKRPADSGIMSVIACSC
jgi:hypothetical protein